MDLGSFWRNGGYDRLVSFIERLNEEELNKLVIETVKGANETLPEPKRATCKPVRPSFPFFLHFLYYF